MSLSDLYSPVGVDHGEAGAHASSLRDPRRELARVRRRVAEEVDREPQPRVRETLAPSRMRRSSNTSPDTWPHTYGSATATLAARPPNANVRETPSTADSRSSVDVVERQGRSTATPPVECT